MAALLIGRNWYSSRRSLLPWQRSDDRLIAIEVIQMPQRASYVICVEITHGKINDVAADSETEVIPDVLRFFDVKGWLGFCAKRADIPHIAPFIGDRF